MILNGAKDPKHTMGLYTTISVICKNDWYPKPALMENDGFLDLAVEQGGL